MHKYLRRLLVTLVAGLFILIPAGVAFADNYDVTAKVPAPLPPDLPVIETPDDNSVQVNQQVLITGTCTIVEPPLIVVLERDGETIGSGVCASDGTFSIMVSLVLGRNVIKVKFMTITGESGGYGTPIVLDYSPPGAAPDNIPSSTAPAQADLGPLTLILDYDFVTYTTTELTPIKITVSGGVPPYKIFIGWGDTTSSNEKLTAPGSFIVNHLYRNIPSQEMKLLVKVQDASGSITEGERALVSFEKITGVAAIQAASTHSNSKTLAIWFTSMVGVTLLATAMYSGHFLSGATHTAVKAHRSALKSARPPVPRGKK